MRRAAHRGRYPRPKKCDGRWRGRTVACRLQHPREGLMKAIGLALAILGCTGAAHAQRSAVSADLSPEAAGQAFRRAVVDACVQAVTGAGVSATAAARDGRLQPTQDAETRK